VSDDPSYSATSSEEGDLDSEEMLASGYGTMPIRQAGAGAASRSTTTTSSSGGSKIRGVGMDLTAANGVDPAAAVLNEAHHLYHHFAYGSAGVYSMQCAVLISMRY
jgi:hypothetical protein